MDIPLPAGLPAGFSSALSAFPGIPTALPAGLLTEPTGFSTVLPTALPSAIPARPSALSAIIPSAAASAPIIAATPIPSAAKPTATGTTTDTTFNCDAYESKLGDLFPRCQPSKATEQAISNQQQADAFFIVFAQCICGNILSVKDDFVKAQAQCPSSDEDKMRSIKALSECEAKNFAAAAYELGMYDDTGDKRWWASQPRAADSANSGAAKMSSFSSGACSKKPSCIKPDSDIIVVHGTGLWSWDGNYHYYIAQDGRLVVSHAGKTAFCPFVSATNNPIKPARTMIKSDGSIAFMDAQYKQYTVDYYKESARTRPGPYHVKVDN
ncbi:hypothetical protein HDU89_004090 [Geranomyces variabilis]|nr:hypothetical protein HDU89_004090 [Geranomyces variabilis]